MIAAIARRIGATRLVSGTFAAVDKRVSGLMVETSAILRATAEAVAIGLGATVAGIAFVTTGVVASYLWLEPSLGPAASMSIICGVFALVTILMMIRMRSSLADIRFHSDGPMPLMSGAKSEIAARNGEQPTGQTARQRPPAARSGLMAASAASTLEAGRGKDTAPSDIDRRIAGDATPPSQATATEPLVAALSSAGIGVVLDRLTPEARAAAAGLVTHARGAVRSGDRATLLAVLGACTAAGWLIGANKWPPGLGRR